MISVAWTLLVSNPRRRGVIRMKVAHFISEFSVLSETFIYDSIRTLEAHGVENRVIALRRRNEKVRPFPRVTVLPSYRRYTPRRLAFYLSARARKDEVGWPRDPALQKAVQQMILADRPEVIHSHFGPAALLMMPVASRLGIPHVVTFYGYDASSLLLRDQWLSAFRVLFDEADHVIGIANRIASRLVEAGMDAGKVTAWHIGPDVDKFAYRNPSEHFNGTDVKCLFIGRLVEKKAPLLLVESFRKALDVVDGRRHLTLTIAGDGPLMDDLRRAVTDAGLTDRIMLSGAVPHARVKELLEAGHIYVQHSRRAPTGDEEGQPVTLAEASACGLPVISTRHAGIPEVILDGKTGILVDEGDTDSMGRAIADLALDETKWEAFGKAGRAHVEANFNLRLQTRKLEDIYRRISGVNG